MSKSKIIRRFERFMFHGVPERPEPTFQRNDHASYTERQTGKPTSSSRSSESLQENSILIGYLKDDFVNQKEIFTRSTSSSKL